MNISLVNENKCFDGWMKQYTHASSVLDCDMRFSVFLPPQAAQGEKLPVLYWLSGLTCSDENFTQKAGAQRIAAELGIILVMPDTSPRGEAVADDSGYDLGQGAGFYVNATQSPWNAHYHMYDYIVSELPALIREHFPVSDKQAISGHSMGGHGALMIALRNPEHYTSVSAFSPIATPTQCPWGTKVLSNYLGDDTESWQAYDSAVLMTKATNHIPALVSQGLDDEFLAEQLKPQALEQAAKASGYPLTLEQHDGYDHSYFFIASFIEQHLRFHAQFLNA